MKKLIQTFVKDESGQTLVEYVLILAFLSVFVIKVLGEIALGFLDGIQALAWKVQKNLSIGEGWH
jgi:Flp pilus assembly pilin Flp